MNINMAAYDVEGELRKARAELRNIRSQLHKVQHQYKQDLKEIQKVVAGLHNCHSNNAQTSGSVSEGPITPRSEQVPGNGDERYPMKPIGYLESPFMFKNGTPRQASISANTRARLTLVKSLFSNPDHSLDGLEQFSYVWIMFVFHKNNNAYTKAKIKPPRLNGKKVGLFSTRCPYRPNPVGLTLARLEKIEGATIHLSGVDIIDGTPILDIKPYIPAYDKPADVELDQLQQNQSSKKENCCADDKTGGRLDLSEAENTAKETQCPDTIESNIDTGEGHFPMEEPMHTDTNECIKSQSTVMDLETEENPNEENKNKVERKFAVSAETTDPGSGNVTQPSEHLSSKEVSSGASARGQVAGWIHNALAKLQVQFSPEAEKQLEDFSPTAKDPNYRLKYLTSTAEARKAICDVLTADPRSTYRRRKCAEDLYYFVLDVVHTTCTFDNDTNTVYITDIKPTSKVPILQKDNLASDDT